MPRTAFSNAIRGVLNRYALTDQLIDNIIPHELKEADVATHLKTAVTNMTFWKNEFANALDQAITALGAIWNAPTYNLAPLGLPMGVQLAATEELSAIRTHAPTPGYDAAKALTNMLRLIKVAER
jgi:hypothetical protein